MAAWAARNAADQRSLRQRSSFQPNSLEVVGEVLQHRQTTLQVRGDENQAIAGLLHDAAEDQGGAATLAEIRASSAMRSPTSWLIARTPGPNQSRHGVRARKHISMFCSINRKRLYWWLSRTRRTTLRPSCLIIARWGRHCGIDSMAVPMGLAGTMASFPASSLGPYREACPTDCRARCRGFPTEAAEINLRFVAVAP
jgi:hypothetical protein